MINKCYLCNSNNIGIVNTKIRDVDVAPKIEFKIFKCQDCNLVFLSSHDHIVDGEFYENSKMLKNDRFLEKTKITNVDKFVSWKKNANFDDERRAEALIDLIANKDVLDYGCGAGGFIEKIYKFCNKLVGVEPDVPLIKYLRANFTKKDMEVPVFSSIREVPDKFDYITCFHVMEHIKDPVLELKNLKNHLRPGGKVFIEVPNINDALLNLYKIEDFRDWYYWTCHLYYYNEKTLKSIGEKAGFNVDYVKQVQRFPLSNHMHWIHKNKPNGHKEYDFLNSDRLKNAYKDELASIGMCDTLVMRLSIE